MSTANRLTRAEAKARTRRLLLESGLDVFARKGFNAATVEEISEQAGFTRGAFYAHFKDKHELFWAVVEVDDASAFGAMADALDHAEGDELQRIEHWFEGLLGLRPLQRAWEEVMAQAGEDDRAHFAGVMAANRDRIVRMVEEQLVLRDVRLDMSTEHLAALFLAVGNGLAQQRQLDPDAIPLSLFSEAFELLWYGALSRTAGPTPPPPPSASTRS